MVGLINTTTNKGTSFKKNFIIIKSREYVSICTHMMIFK